MHHPPDGSVTTWDGETDDHREAGMFRRIDNLEGGPGDFDEWATHAKSLGKNVLIPIAIAVLVILAICLVGAALQA